MKQSISCSKQDKCIYGYAMKLYLPVFFIAFFLLCSTNSFAILPPLRDVQTTTQTSGGQTYHTFKVFDQQRNEWKESQTATYASNKITSLQVVDGVVNWVVDTNTNPSGSPNYRGYCSVYDPKAGGWNTKYTELDEFYYNRDSNKGVVYWTSNNTFGTIYKKHYINIFDPASQTWKEYVSSNLTDSQNSVSQPVIGDGVIAWIYYHKHSIGSNANTVTFWTLAYDAITSSWSDHNKGYYNANAVSYAINSITSGTVNYTIAGQSYSLGYDSYTTAFYKWGAYNTVPIARSVPSQTAGAIPLKVYFWDMSIGGSSYSWNFGNGSTSTDQAPFYTYTNAFGSPFTVSQTVSGPGGTKTYNQNISPTSPHSISGTISNSNGFKISGVTVTLIGTNSGSTQTDSNGNYSFANLTGGGSYSVSVSKARYSFSPPSINFTNLNGNQTANFTGKLIDKQSDFDGDGKTDLSIFRPGTEYWWIQNSSNSSSTSINFGLSTDQITPRDFDGDGKTDVAVWRSSNGGWYVLRSSNSTVLSATFGTSGDIPAAGDFDGDDKADFAVFRPSDASWHILPTSTSQYYGFSFGLGTDIPVPGDYDGDNKTDVAVFRPGTATWYILKSSDSNVITDQFGNSGDKPAQGDYDGDGKTDLATFRPSDLNWRIKQSSNSTVTTTFFGLSTDQLAPGDYDGDGKTDIATFRASSGVWYILKSSDQTILYSTYGTSGDLATPSSYIP